jgi:AdoMet-dependent heme synthase
MRGSPTSRGHLRPEAITAREERDRLLAALDFDAAPFTIAWELTRACAYKCAHCRADAQPRRDHRELDTSEGKHLIDRLAGFGTRPILVLTGGDPLMRRDVFELARHADERGLRVSLTPTATALSTRRRMRAARAAGIRRVAFSVDGADSTVHDRFRGFGGSFARTLAGIANARAEGLPLQINTTVCADNVGELPRLVPLLEEWGVVQWSVFFLVPVGRGARRLCALRRQGHSCAPIPADRAAALAPSRRRGVPVCGRARPPGHGQGRQRRARLHVHLSHR